jgi:molybdopterin synthase catalytic subunit
LTIRLYQSTFSPYQELANYLPQTHSVSASIGATAIFIGTMRDQNHGDLVLGLTLEHYPEMTERQLASIEQQARRKWDLIDVLVGHRIGEIAPNDAIVLVAVWSTHRQEAFEACRFIMETLKTSAPFWKKEQLIDKARWVEGNTEGYSESR